MLSEQSCLKAMSDYKGIITISGPVFWCAFKVMILCQGMGFKFKMPREKMLSVCEQNVWQLSLSPRDGILYFNSQGRITWLKRTIYIQIFLVNPVKPDRMESVEREGWIDQSKVGYKEPVRDSTICEVCYKCFDTIVDLKQHWQSHKKLKKYKCIVWQKTFP